MSLATEHPDGVTFPLHLRLPGWCTEPHIWVNGVAIAAKANALGFHVETRAWKSGDNVTGPCPHLVHMLAAGAAGGGVVGQVWWVSLEWAGWGRRASVRAHARKVHCDTYFDAITVPLAVTLPMAPKIETAKTINVGGIQHDCQRGSPNAQCVNTNRNNEVQAGRTLQSGHFCLGALSVNGRRGGVCRWSC